MIADTLPVSRRKVSILLFLASIFVSLPFTSSSQAFPLSFSFKAAGQKVYLSAFYGEKMSVIDSGLTSAKGEVNFLMKAGRRPGIYRVSIGRQQFLDFIYNKEKISVEMDWESPGGSPRVIESKENEIFYHFLKYEMVYQKKINVLQLTGQEYPEKDQFYSLAESEYLKLQKERKELLNSLIDGNRGSFAAHVLMLYREPDIAWGLAEQEKKVKLREHYFDHFSLSDTLLIRTNLLTAKAIDYLSLYASQQMTQSEVEDSFIKGVDVIMANVEKDPVVYEFLLSYLVGGFEKYKMEKVLTHLYEKYLSGDHCPGDVKQDELARRLKAYEQLALGKIAPEVNLKEQKGSLVKLAALNREYYLLVFWASWCPHCHDLLSNLPKLKDEFNRLNALVITVSLDTSLTAWNEYLLKYTPPFTNTCDGGGWNGTNVKAYNIYATPTMFLLDRQRKIIAKPITYTELTEELRRLGSGK